ncbi:MAG: hypothetical protein WA738_05595 [Candidatus Angelobacter sp.]
MKQRDGYGFQDKRSYTKADGAEVLYGRDWDERRFELLQRSRGTCENVINGVRCRHDCEDPHHMELRSVRRDDRLSNLLAVCRQCHRKLDTQQREAKRAIKRARIQELGAA